MAEEGWDDKSIPAGVSSSPLKTASTAVSVAGAMTALLKK